MYWIEHQFRDEIAVIVWKWIATTYILRSIRFQFVFLFNSFLFWPKICGRDRNYRLTNRFQYSKTKTNPLIHPLLIEGMALKRAKSAKYFNINTHTQIFKYVWEFSQMFIKNDGLYFSVLYPNIIHKLNDHTAGVCWSIFFARFYSIYFFVILL